MEDTKMQNLEDMIRGLSIGGGEFETKDDQRKINICEEDKLQKAEQPGVDQRV